MSGGDRVGDAYQYLEKIQEDGTLVDVITTLKEYSNMALTALSVTRDAATGNVMNAQLTLRKIFQVSTLTVEVPEPKEVAKSRGKGRNLGNVATTPAAPAAAEAASNRSSLFSIGSAVLGG